MIEPTHEDGWEIATSTHAQQFWWPKNHDVHQCWENGEWHVVGWGQDFHNGWTYRRPAPKTTEQEHFI